MISIIRLFYAFSERILNEGSAIHLELDLISTANAQIIGSATALAFEPFKHVY